MDIRDLAFEDESFDIAIDKGKYMKASCTAEFLDLFISIRYHGRHDDDQGGRVGRQPLKRVTTDPKISAGSSSSSHSGL